MLIIALAIKCDSKGPVFFKQKRVGIHKKHFNLLKFRSMYITAPHDVPTHELNDPSKCITKVGKFLRKTSLDELPQIFNKSGSHPVITIYKVNISPGSGADSRVTRNAYPGIGLRN